jgi:ATP-dependent Clp protease ATP-binding subunit ClpA
MERHVLGKARRSFRPELFARITEKLVFNRLTFDVQLGIAAAMLAAELSFFADKGIALTAAPAVLPFLVQRGFHPQLGARPLRDVVEKYVRDTMTAALLCHREIKRASITVANAQLALVAEAA